MFTDSIKYATGNIVASYTSRKLVFRSKCSTPNRLNTPRGTVASCASFASVKRLLSDGWRYWPVPLVIMSAVYSARDSLGSRLSKCSDLQPVRRSHNYFLSMWWRVSLTFQVRRLYKCWVSWKGVPDVMYAGCVSQALNGMRSDYLTAFPFIVHAGLSVFSPPGAPLRYPKMVSSLVVECCSMDDLDPFICWYEIFHALQDTKIKVVALHADILSESAWTHFLRCVGRAFPKGQLRTLYIHLRQSVVRDFLPGRKPTYRTMQKWARQISPFPHGFQ